LVERGELTVDGLRDQLARGGPAPACLVGRPVGDAVQPGSQGVRPANGGSPTRQDEESRLECVVGIGVVAGHAPAQTMDHGPVPRDQGRERSLIALPDEAIQERGVRVTVQTGRA
jgi:hypothetical protein